MKSPSLLFIVLMSALPIFQAAAANKETQRVEKSTTVLKDVAAIPDKTIPNYLFQKAEGIAIIPGVIGAALGIGGRWGEGIMVVRTSQGTWSDPTFLTLYGGSIGWQGGRESTDLVLLFKTKQSVQDVEKGKVTLGTRASVAAGPIGRSAEASTDAQLKAQIYSYAETRGKFVGVAVQGSVLKINNSANSSFYNQKNLTATKIFSGKVKSAPASVAQLKKTLADLSLGKVAGADTQQGDSTSAKSDSAKKAEMTGPGAQPSK